MEDEGVSEISLTDPDARSMMNNQRVEPCYNIQEAVDSKHKLVLDFEATNEPADQHQLNKMATRAKEILEVDTIEATADKGYYDSQDIKATVDARIIPFIPKPARSRPKEDELFAKEKFTYDKNKDVYICPAKSQACLYEKSR